MADEERELVQAAAGGDFRAFERLVSRHERRLYALAWHFTRDHHDAQDVVQNSLLSAVEHLPEFKGDSLFSTWLTRIAVNNALRVLRRRRQWPTASLSADEHEDALPLPEHIADWRGDPRRDLDRRELRAVLDEGIAALPEGQRLVFVLRDVQGQSVRDTAAMLGLSEANVKVRLLRARLALREFLTRRFGDESSRVAPARDHDHAFLTPLLTRRDDDPPASGAGGDL
jgi:RNA polymerase sigma-70 factor (ECF subfamily)